MRTPFAILIFTFIAAGCGREVVRKDRLVDLEEYSAFHDVRTLDNAALAQAADAIVKISDAYGSGTGFFVNGGGRLVTNNHVVGVKGCPTTGCYVTIHRGYQVGREFQKDTEVFAVPQVVDTMLDVSVLQLYETDRTTPLASPAYLTLAADNGPSLMNRTVYLIGHPAGGLKKWAEGKVFDYQGDWVQADYFSVGGTSGSPVLDDAGQVVGIHHRSSGGATTITESSMLKSAYFSSAAGIANVLNGNTMGLALLDPENMPSKSEVATQEQAFYNARQMKVKVHTEVPAAAPETTEVTVLSALGEACDAGLAETYFSDPEEFDASLAACDSAEKWITCLPDELAESPHKSCLTGDERQAWEARFARRSEKYRAHWVNNIDYASVRTSTIFLDDSTARAKARQAAYQGELDRVAPPLTPGLAGEIYVRLGSPTYGGVSIPKYLKNYDDQPYYERYAYNIFFGLFYLYKDGIISGDDLAFELKSLIYDGKVPLGDKLDLEAIAYEIGLL